MRFVAAPSIEATYETLLAQWWGREGTLHIDCWSEISQADGYEISLLPEPYEGKEKLYYVNLGGYDGVTFAEQHRNVFVVADSLPAAKARAIKQAAGWTDAHRDEMYEAEQAFALDDAAQAERLHIHLKPSLMTGEPNFTCHYTPIR